MGSLVSADVEVNQSPPRAVGSGGGPTRGRLATNEIYFNHKSTGTERGVAARGAEASQGVG